MHAHAHCHGARHLRQVPPEQLNACTGRETMQQAFAEAHSKAKRAAGQVPPEAAEDNTLMGALRAAHMAWGRQNELLAALTVIRGKRSLPRVPDFVLQHVAEEFARYKRLLPQEAQR